MLWLNKVAPLIFLPLVGCMLLLALSIAIRRWWLVWVTLVLLYAASIPVIGDSLMATLENRVKPSRIAEVGPADAIIVLSGIFGPPVSEGFLPNLSEAVDRLEGGIELYCAGIGPWLVFTGGRLPWERNKLLEGEVSKSVAIRRGVPSAQILVSREVGNTAEEAETIFELAQAREWRRIVLVTTAWHMPRALHQFRRGEIEVTPFPVDYRIDPNRSLSVLDFLPSAAGLRNTEVALRELYGNLYYRIVD